MQTGGLHRDSAFNNRFHHKREWGTCQLEESKANGDCSLVCGIGICCDVNLQKTYHIVAKDTLGSRGVEAI